MLITCLSQVPLLWFGGRTVGSDDMKVDPFITFLS